MLGQLLAADPGYRGARVSCGNGHEAGFIAYRGKVTGTVLGPVTVTRAAAAVPFEEAAGLLEELAGVRLTVKRVERAAEASGAAAAAAVRERAALITARKLVPLQ
jgi:hypothetical protein